MPYSSHSSTDDPRTGSEAYGGYQRNILADGVNCLHEQLGEKQNVREIHAGDFSPCGGCMACLWADEASEAFSAALANPQPLANPQ